MSTTFGTRREQIERLYLRLPTASGGQFDIWLSGPRRTEPERLLLHESVIEHLQLRLQQMQRQEEFEAAGAIAAGLAHLGGPGE